MRGLCIDCEVGHTPCDMGRLATLTLPPWSVSAKTSGHKVNSWSIQPLPFPIIVVIADSSNINPLVHISFKLLHPLQTILLDSHSSPERMREKLHLFASSEIRICLALSERNFSTALIEIPTEYDLIRLPRKIKNLQHARNIIHNSPECPEESVEIYKMVSSDEEIFLTDKIILNFDNAEAQLVIDGERFGKLDSLETMEISV